MSDIVERTGVGFGSLYQYFPDKTAIIGTLAARYNAIGRDCVHRDLSAVNTEELHPALCRIVDSYYSIRTAFTAVGTKPADLCNDLLYCFQLAEQKNTSALRAPLPNYRASEQAFRPPHGAGMQQTNLELAESLHQFITVWKMIRRPFPRVDQTDRPGLAITWPEIQFPFYNALFLTEQLTDAPVLRDRVQEAAAYMRARANMGWFVVCLDNLRGAARESLPTILDQAKLVQAIPMTGMAGNILPMEASGHPALRFERILDDPTIQEFAQINCVSYGVPKEACLSLIKEHTFWHEHAYGFVAYEDDKPMSTATAIIHEGCLFLFLVATMPEARRKGYGEAAVRHALQRAYEATGIRRTVLHATGAGYPLYLHLGYRPTVKFMGCMLGS